MSCQENATSTDCGNIVPAQPNTVLCPELLAESTEQHTGFFALLETSDLYRFTPDNFVAVRVPHTVQPVVVVAFNVSYQYPLHSC